MFSQIEQVLEELKPLIESVGVDATLTDAIDGIATIALAKSDVNANADMVRLKGFIEREIMDEVSVVREVVFEGITGEPEVSAPPTVAESSPRLTLDVVQPEDSEDTCIFTVSQIVGPPGSELFESPEDAESFPLFQLLLKLEGVAAVMAHDKMIVVTKSHGTWSEVIAACSSVIREHLGGDSPDDDLKARIQHVLDTDINPAVAMHGGHIELLDVKGTEAFVHMGGGCQGCGQAAMTLKHGVQTSIIEAVPEITAVYDTTDHAAGSNPFYRGT